MDLSSDLVPSLNPCILTKCYCSTFPIPLLYWAFSSTARITCTNKMYTNSDIFSYITCHIQTSPCIICHVNHVYRFNNMLKYKVYRKRTLKTTMSIPNSNSCYPANILYTCCVHSHKKIIWRWLINASYFHNIRISVRINVYPTLTLSFDMLNRLQYPHSNLITIAFLHS